MLYSAVLCILDINSVFDYCFFITIEQQHRIPHMRLESSYHLVEQRNSCILYILELEYE